MRYDACFGINREQYFKPQWMFLNSAIDFLIKMHTHEFASKELRVIYHVWPIGGTFHFQFNNELHWKFITFCFHSFIHSQITSFTFFLYKFFYHFYFPQRAKKRFFMPWIFERFQTNKQTTFQTNSSKEINYLWSAIKIGLWAKLWYCKLQLVSFFASYVSFWKLMFLDSGQWPSTEIDFSL